MKYAKKWSQPNTNFQNINTIFGIYILHVLSFSFCIRNVYLYFFLLWNVILYILYLCFIILKCIPFLQTIHPIPDDQWFVRGRPAALSARLASGQAAYGCAANQTITPSLTETEIRISPQLDGWWWKHICVNCDRNFGRYP